MESGWLAACLFFSTRFCALGRQVVAVEGTVIDADTGFPVAGAQVVLCYLTSENEREDEPGLPGREQFPGIH
jgi:hypothetical protein